MLPCDTRPSFVQPHSTWYISHQTPSGVVIHLLICFKNVVDCVVTYLCPETYQESPTGAPCHPNIDNWVIVGQLPYAMTLDYPRTFFLCIMSLSSRPNTCTSVCKSLLGVQYKLIVERWNVTLVHITTRPNRGFRKRKL